MCSRRINVVIFFCFRVNVTHSEPAVYNVLKLLIFFKGFRYICIAIMPPYIDEWKREENMKIFVIFKCKSHTTAAVKICLTYKINWLKLVYR